MDAIKREHIEPVPRWHFMLKDYVLWSAFFVSVLLGSVSVGMAMDSFSRHWNIYSHLKGSLGGFVLMVFPYAWAGLLVGFLALAYCDWKHTRHAYRHRTYMVVLASVVASVALGGAGQALGFGKQFDRAMRHAMPVYKQAVEEKEKAIWSNPEIGTLAGEIKEAVQEDVVIVEDFRGREWQVRCEKCGVREDEGADQGDGEKSERKKVKMLGKKESEKGFVAEKVSDWGEDEADGGDEKSGRSRRGGDEDDKEDSREEKSGRDGRNDERDGDRDD